VRAYLGARLLSRKGEVIGILELCSFRPYAHSPEEISFLEQIGRQATIAIIIGYTGMIREKQSHVMEPESRRWLEAVQRSAEDLFDLIKRVLPLTPINHGKMILLEEIVDPAIVLVEAIDPLRQKAEKKGITLRTELAADLPPLIVSDGLKLRQIVRNLVDSAVKFTRRGSIWVRAGIHAPRLQIEVEDTGGGSERGFGSDIRSLSSDGRLADARLQRSWHRSRFSQRARATDGGMAREKRTRLRRRLHGFPPLRHPDHDSRGLARLKGSVGDSLGPIVDAGMFIQTLAGLNSLVILRSEFDLGTLKKSGASYSRPPLFSCSRPVQLRPRAFWKFCESRGLSPRPSIGRPSKKPRVRTKGSLPP
jgi:hypothetical protein